ncbi:WG repeat-containing protein [uncultured Acidaminococcus sp.]|uniref:WG repeat-containing protein n=1 Tax=uncultured Acidaminococcus sp. TaxID=352152 RepID=UPI002803B30E|nr:WG repeat-containing protein [uncultured Acidaminococcus sp.]
MNRKQMALLVGLSLALGQTAFAADHVAVVEKDGKQGVIDRTGKEILPLVYKKIAVGDPKEDPAILVQLKGKYGLYDREGKQLLAPTLKKITDINEGIIGGVTEKKWNFYTLQGARLPGEWEEARAFQEGLAPVKTQGKWGFADKTGKLVIPAQYKEVRSFSEGLAAVKKDSQWFYIRKDGSLLPSMSVKKAGDFHQGVAVVDGGWLMDTQGKKYAKLKPYSFVGDFQDNGLAEVGVRRASHSFLDYISIGWGWGDGWGWGGPYWGVGPGWGPYWGDYGYHHHHHHHGWGGSIGISPGAVMPSSMYRGYVNKQGQEVISPTYSFVSPFYGKLALIRDEGHWGMVDAKGQVVIPAAYDALLPFSEGLAAFQSDKKWGFIDETNKVVIPNRFDSVQNFFQDRTTAVEKEKGGIIDKTGNPVAPFRSELRELGPLTADRAAYKDAQKKKWGYVDENAKVVISPQYDKAGIFD